MLVKIKQKIRCGIGAEEGNSSVSSSYVLDRKILIHKSKYWLLKAIEGSIESRENVRKNIEKILDIWYDVI